jgi:SNF2 family DNA or RNA helicase
MNLTKTTPYAHQAQAIRMALDRVSFAYLMEQGTGKSLCLLADATHLYQTNKINCLVIVAPKGCYLNWQRDEFPKHMRSDIPYRIETWVAPSKQGIDKTAKLEAFRTVEMPYLKVLLVNVEALAFSDTYGYLSDVLRRHNTMMAVDESTFIRTASSKRCLYARRLGVLAKYRRILTGTPIANRPLDLYGQCVFLDPKLLGFPTFQAFKHYYADIGYFRGGKRLDPDKENVRGPGVFPVLVGYRHLPQLTEELNKFSFRVLKKDCLDLPDKVYEIRYVEATSEQKRLYNSMRDEMLSSFDSGAIATAPLALTKLMRLQTILCGHIKTDDGDTLSIANNRPAAWQEIVDEVDGKVITFCWYKEDIRQLVKDLPKASYAEYHGDVDEAGRADALERFRNDSLCKYFFATQSTGGTGLTLNEAHTVIYYSQGYDLEKRLQSEDRCHRIGQTKKVTYYDLVVADTVDEKIADALIKKQDIADTILLKLKSYLPALAKQV